MWPDALEHASYACQVLGPRTGSNMASDRACRYVLVGVCLGAGPRGENVGQPSQTIVYSL